MINLKSAEINYYDVSKVNSLVNQIDEIKKRIKSSQKIISAYQNIIDNAPAPPPTDQQLKRLMITSYSRCRILPIEVSQISYPKITIPTFSNISKSQARSKNIANHTPTLSTDDSTPYSHILFSKLNSIPTNSSILANNLKERNNQQQNSGIIPIVKNSIQKTVQEPNPPILVLSKRRNAHIMNGISFIFRQFGTTDVDIIQNYFLQCHQYIDNLKDQIKQSVRQCVFLEEESFQLKKPTLSLREEQNILFQNRSDLVATSDDIHSMEINLKNIIIFANKTSEILGIKSEMPHDINSVKTLLQEINNYFKQPAHLSKIKSVRAIAGHGNFKVINSIPLNHSNAQSRLSSSVLNTPLQKQLKLNLSLTKESNSTVDAASLGSIPDIAEENDDFDTSSNIPTLGLASNLYKPGTRLTRRVFSSISSLRSSENTSVGISSELETMGRHVGFAFVERYAANLIEMPVKSTIERSLGNPEIPPGSFAPTESKDILTELFAQYYSFRAYLYLGVFSLQDTFFLDESFSRFLSSRNAGIAAFNSNFDFEIFKSEWSKLVLKNEAVALYALQDFYVQSRIGHHVDELMLDFGHLLSEREDEIIKKSAKAPDVIISVESCYVFIPWMYLLSTIWNEGDYSSLIDPDALNKIFEIFMGQPHSIQCRAGLSSYFKLGVRLPEKLFQPASFNGSSIPPLINFMYLARKLPSALEAAIDYFNSTRPFFDQETTMCYTFTFLHLIIDESCRQPIRPTQLSLFLESMINIVSDRSRFTRDQLGKLNFIHFLIKQVELEAMVTAGGNPLKDLQYKKDEQTKDQKEQEQIPVIPSTNNIVSDTSTKAVVGYLDLPKLSFTSLNTNSDSKTNNNHTINIENPKLQLHFQAQATENAKANAKNNVSIPYSEYATGRKRYPIYCNELIHVRFIQLFFATIIDTRLHRLDVFFCDPFPQVNRKPNVLYTLQRHLESPANADIIDQLVDLFTNNSGAQRLLRLIIPKMFNPDKYSGGVHVASGAFGAVMAVPIDETIYAVKILEKSRNEFDNPHLNDVYQEISILDLCHGDRHVTQLFDYGCSVDFYFIVMEFYPATLKSWRRSLLKRNDSVSVGTLLRIFKEFLDSATVLSTYHINHFDIKCDNVMLDTNGYPALADFGEAMCYTDESNCYTMLNKGTEWIKSPEMLSIAINSTVTNPNFDRLKKVGAGPASDVWSIGCLFFELLTGEYLFVDSDWSRFYLRVTDSKEAILTREKIKMLPKDPRYAQFIEFILQRPVRTRPDLVQVINKFNEMFPDASDYPLPTLNMPKFLVNQINQ